MISRITLKQLKMFSEGQGKTAKFNLEDLRETLTLLGFTVEPAVILVSPGARAIEAESRRLELPSCYADSSKGFYEVYLSRPATGIDAAAWTKAMSSRLTIGPRKPAQPVFGEIYCKAMTPMTLHAEYEVWGAKIKGWQIAKAGSKITAPSGKSKDVPIAEWAGEGKPTGVWGWAMKQGLADLAKEKLESLGAASALPKPVSTRDLSNTGTCPCCFKNVKINSRDGVISRHGWSVAGQRRRDRAGQSWHTGPCFGTGYRPFEESPSGTKKYRAFLKKSLASHQEALNEEPETLDFRNRPYPKGSRRYEGALKDRRRRIQYEIEQLMEAIVTLGQTIATWKSKPLP